MSLDMGAKAKADAKALAMQKRSLELLDLQAVMAMPQGKRFLRRLLGMTRVFHISYDPSNAGTTIFNEGRRDIGLKLMADMSEADSVEYMKIVGPKDRS